jgi:hypothetical protein
MKKRIDFLVAGVQKCGTGSLHSLLAQHSAISMSRMKEPHFFDKNGFTASEAAYRAYHQHGWGIGGGELDERVLYAESTPKYTLHKPSGRPRFMARIADYNPAVKLIVLFRDPVDRAYSQWNMLRREGRDVPTFNKMMEALLCDPPQPAMDGTVLYRGQYGRVVSNLLENFPSDNLLFLKTEDLNAQMKTIESFLRIEPGEYKPRYNHVAEYESVIDPAIADRLREFYAADMDIFARLSGIDVSDWVS